MPFKDPLVRKAWVREYFTKNRTRLYSERRETLYGLSADQFDAMLREQDGKCAICRMHLERPNVDHNHSTGKVRALLCRWCNFAIGWAKDNPEVLEAMAAYVRRHA